MTDNSQSHFILTTSLALLSFLSLLLSCTGSISSDPSPSNNSETIIINTAAELQAITNNIATLDSIKYNSFRDVPEEMRGKAVQYIGGNYQLGSDIDMSGITNFVPIGTFKTPFIGKFNGNGHAVTLDIDSAESSLGLFGYVGIDYEHTDDTTALSNVNGAIEIENIKISGTITVNSAKPFRAGGLVGVFNGGSLIGYSEVTITGQGGNSAGGLVGTQNGGSIIGYATGNVSRNIYFIGGFIGYQDSGTATGYATGAVSGGGPSSVGGFIGESKAVGGVKGGYFDAASTGRTDTVASNISAAANIYKFTGPAETSGRTVGKFYDKTTGTSSTAEDSGDTEIFTEPEFIDAFDLANTPNGSFPKLKPSLFGPR